MIPFALSLAFFKQLSLLIFLGIFTTAVVWALRLKKSRLQTDSQLPLNDGQPSITEHHHD